MAKFTQWLSSRRKAPVGETVNLAGGRAFRQSARLELVSVLLTTFLEDEFYRSEGQAMQRIRELIAKVGDPVFVAKAAVYARHVHGMRSVSHLVAGELAHSVKGEAWTRGFFCSVVRRPDDVTEILAYSQAVHGRPIPNALKKGLGRALGRFDEHQIAKYRRDHAAFKLVDAVNLLHPAPTPALSKLVKGQLGAARTWEAALAAAGEADSPAGARSAKARAWRDLVAEGRLGYLALLRNVRNILQHAPEVTDLVVAQLTDREVIGRSLVLPFQFLPALEALRHGNLPHASRMMEALNEAAEASLSNVPAYEGSTLVALDCSGSMAGRPRAIGSLFAAMLVRSVGADLLVFSDDARYVSLNRRDGLLSSAESIPFKAAGTNFHGLFQAANRPYDRIVILSDMQAWMGDGAPTEALAAYRRRHRADPSVFSVDLKGYGTLQFPQERVYCLAGWNERVFEIMAKLDQDPHALVSAVEAVSIAG